MHGRLASACVLALLGAATAQAATPPGEPRVGVDRDSDHRAHPETGREWWRLTAIAPRGRGIIRLEVVRQHGGATLRFVVGAPDGTELAAADQPLNEVRARARSLDAVGAHAAVHIRRRARRMVATIELDGIRCRVTLTAIRRGPAARGFKLGHHRNADPAIRRLRLGLNWSMPVARARTAMKFVRDGRVLAAPQRWLGSYEHGWGDLDLADGEWDHWDEYVVHHHSTTWVLFGLNRADTITGPGARDAMWLGALARVTRHGVSVCRAHIRRPHWHHSSSGPWMLWPLEVRAQCGALAAVFRDRVYVGADYLNHFISTATASVNRRGRGWAWHAGH